MGEEGDRAKGLVDPRGVRGDKGEGSAGNSSFFLLFRDMVVIDYSIKIRQLQNGQYLLYRSTTKK